MVGVLFVMPFSGRWKLGHTFNVAFIFGLFGGIAILTGLARFEDSRDEDYRAAVADAEQKAERVKVLAQIKGIGPAGAGHLFHQNPQTPRAPPLPTKSPPCPP